jgi:hypothetical protein
MFTELWRIREAEGGQKFRGKLKICTKYLDGKPKELIPVWRCSKI